MLRGRKKLGRSIWPATGWFWCGICSSGRRDSNPRQPAWKAGALPTELHPRFLFRALEPSTGTCLERPEALPTELHPHVFFDCQRSYTRMSRFGSNGFGFQWIEPGQGSTASWMEVDSNHRRHKTADLQSAPFGHSGIHPGIKLSKARVSGGAGGGTRTRDLLITSQVLYQLSYASRLPAYEATTYKRAVVTRQGPAGKRASL